ncbi:hypothetical protein [Litoreibacter arenae]|uniref:Lipoprotein n=1 Tax=Litoreibacter arenae DSM 19593 TaxID=1123360 RepID=S9RPB8_9RHOB|nr:hypothetical protein [Litoreibacter arenae]EPX79930.1 hypothetical protein thalar_01266 [Litoreibacter arenae DSM 19593]
MIRLLLVTSLVLGTASCGLLSRDKSRAAVSERALPYKAKLSAGEDKRNIAISVVNKGAGLEAVRESVRFEATKYCLLNYGGSDTEWQISPVSNDWAFTQDGEKLVFNARCVAR